MTGRELAAAFYIGQHFDFYGQIVLQALFKAQEAFVEVVVCCFADEPKHNLHAGD